ncbi:MAG: hypothetical protein NC335_12745, partial [Bacteroides sp.]|nr:hypothetical protein [Bacteroides sp.]
KVNVPVFGRRPDEEERQRIRRAIESGEIRLPKFADLMMEFDCRRLLAANAHWAVCRDAHEV